MTRRLLVLWLECSAAQKSKWPPYIQCLLSTHFILIQFHPISLIHFSGRLARSRDSPLIAIITDSFNLAGITDAKRPTFNFPSALNEARVHSFSFYSFKFFTKLFRTKVRILELGWEPGILTTRQYGIYKFIVGNGEIRSLQSSANWKIFKFPLKWNGT